MTALKIIDNSYIDKYAQYKNIGLIRNTNNIVYNTDPVKSLKLNQTCNLKQEFIICSGIFITIIGSLLSMLSISSIVSNITLLVILCVFIDILKSV